MTAIEKLDEMRESLEELRREHYGVALQFLFRLSSECLTQLRGELALAISDGRIVSRPAKAPRLRLVVMPKGNGRKGANDG